MQEIESAANVLKTFTELTLPAMVLVIVMVFLFFQIQQLRYNNARDKRTSETNDKMLELMAGMQKGARDRQAQIDRFAAQTEKSDDLSRAALAGVQSAMTNLATSNENQTTSIRALIGRTDHSVTLLQGVSSAIETKASALAVESLTRLVNEINAYICEAIPKLATRSEFDAAIGRLEAVQRITQDAIKECVDKKKTATDEHKVTVTIVPPTDVPASDEDAPGLEKAS